MVFNFLQLRAACFHAQLVATKPFFQATAPEIQSLNSNDSEMTLNNISKRTYRPAASSNSTSNKLLNHIKTIGDRAIGSAYSRATLRTCIHALIYNQGLSSIFLTLNPVDIHSPVALYFASVKLDLDNIQTEQFTTTYERAEIIAFSSCCYSQVFPFINH